jgi:hypothetical protein
MQLNKRKCERKSPPVKTLTGGLACLQEKDIADGLECDAWHLAQSSRKQLIKKQQGMT